MGHFSEFSIFSEANMAALDFPDAAIVKPYQSIQNLPPFKSFTPPLILSASKSLPFVRPEGYINLLQFLRQSGRSVSEIQLGGSERQFGC
jgi:hypothetical protein